MRGFICSMRISISYLICILMEFIANVNEFIKGKFTLTHMPFISYTYQ